MTGGQELFEIAGEWLRAIPETVALIGRLILDMMTAFLVTVLGSLIVMEATEN